MRNHVLCLVGILLLTACGGGGGGGGGGESPEALFSGDHGLVSFHGQMDPILSRVRFGALTANGAGAFTTEFSENNDGSVLTGKESHTYSISGNRELTLARPVGSYFTGRISAAGHVAALASLTPGISPGVRLHLRRGTGLGDADLSGTYRVCEIAFFPGLDKLEGLVGTYSFHGTGTFTGSVFSNIDGGVFGPSPVPAGTYSVSNFGGCDLTQSAGVSSYGQLLQSGDVLCVGGGTEDLDHRRYSCFIREGSGMNLSSLSGTYYLAGIYYDFGSGVEDYVGIGGTLTADGAGVYTATFLRNQDTFISAGTTQESGTYTVSATGKLTIHRSDGQAYEGGLAQDLSFGMYGGGTSTLSRPGIYFLVK